MENISFESIDWQNIPATEHKGETGVAYWKTRELNGLRVRIVDYSANYMADHWCAKGHIVHCLEGEFVSELKNGEQTLMKAGDTYVVSDDMSQHRSSTANGAKLLIIDGDFLKKV